MVYTVEQLNFFKLSKLAVDEFSEALRQTLKHMWDRKFGPTAAIWDDFSRCEKLVPGKRGVESQLQSSRTQGPTGNGIAPRCSKPLSTRKRSLYPTIEVTLKLLVSCT